MTQHSIRTIRPCILILVATAISVSGCNQSNSGEPLKTNDTSLDVLETQSIVEPDDSFFAPITTSAAETWSTNGVVNRLITIGNTLFVGGQFTSIYSPEGEVFSRTHIAAFNRYTGEPIDFSPVLDNGVWALATSPDESTLYIGGAFLSVDGQRRSRVAAFDVQTGALTSFRPPAPNSGLRAIATTDTKVYFGGLFTTMGGVQRPYVAAVDAATGALDTGFDASANDNVQALAIGPEGLWMGGNFFEINQTDQRGLGLVDLDDGSLLTADSVTADVLDIALTDSQVFVAVGGVGGRAVALDRTSRSTQWTLASDGDVHGVDANEGSYVYFAGHYGIIEGNEAADGLTRHDKLTGELDVSWIPKVNGIRSVSDLEVQPDGLYIGGDFTQVNQRPQEGLAILPGLTE